MTPSVALFNKLGWIPFYEQHKIDKCIIMYKRINGYLPNCVVPENIHTPPPHGWFFRLDPQEKIMDSHFWIFWGI